MGQVEPSAVLRGILERERDCCSALAAVLEKERGAASSHDLAALLASNKEREALQAHWARIAGRRREWERRSGARLGDLMHDDEGLVHLHAEIAHASGELQRAQRVNQTLIRAVLGQLGGMIDAIRRELPSSRYDSGASLTGPAHTGGSVARSA